MKFENTTASQCSFAKYIPQWFKELEVIEDLSDVCKRNLSSEVKILCKKNDRYYILHYIYCGCRACKDMVDKKNSKKIEAKLESLILEYTFEHLKETDFGFDFAKLFPELEEIDADFEEIEPTIVTEVTEKAAAVIFHDIPELKNITLRGFKPGDILEKGRLMSMLFATLNEKIADEYGEVVLNKSDIQNELRFPAIATELPF
jgi:hypothetical protein